MLDDQLVTAYLDRIGATRPGAPDLAGLRHLQERQVLSVPFENLDYHLGEEIYMDERVLDKIVRAHRGGGCFEVNPALAFLLRSLGYHVDILPGRVHRPDGLGPLQGHLALRVRADGEDWLVDTGFGRNSRFPLALASRDEHDDPHGRYRIADSDNGAIDLFYNGKPLYQVVPNPVEIADFAPTLWWYRTAPESSFLQALFCSIRTETGMVTLKGDLLSTVVDGVREQVRLADDEAVLQAYKEHFGFGLDKLPAEPEGGVTTGVRVE
ncbi:arylamine N-acetyltransferase family protein [Actinokineospora globicatena]|uniref:arylamine N-acetyltransferase family protein n=1 Tax=Actinokineospora globicatena TaxID=103729 RepID=UPI0020A350A5|nr:arylamine N-acetyltransferase [Actinokineospora globicatena]MCP2303161.1 N-hydroxyarylamine O-acetyltransferase [Actinokineospora globicatena]GLW79722.1 N-hydroxyarylamine O-acetyltransferase [Actinokineospora globicatena]GLW85868.1 N-hydroxyarylamine O-acetyltransferase [Actinokineospora globicatena]